MGIQTSNISGPVAGNTITIETAGSEVARFDGNGYIRLASGTGGIQFNGDTAAANALDDYEEGTFTPALEFGGGNTGIVYSTNAFYKKVGNVVFIILSIDLSNKGTSTGEARIISLPFASVSTQFATLNARAVSNLTFTPDLYASVQANELNKISLQDNNSGTQRFLTNTAFTNTTGLEITGFYFTA